LERDLRSGRRKEEGMRKKERKATPLTDDYCFQWPGGLAQLCRGERGNNSRSAEKIGGFLEDVYVGEQASCGFLGLIEFILTS
jgi:hypothetical protein